MKSRSGSARIRRRLASVVLGATAITAAGIPLSSAAQAEVTCPCSLFSPSDVPNVVDANDGDAVELGAQFSSSVSGTVTGVRYYKSDANTGTHVGSLWTTTGTLLAQATFENETANGWQQVSFSAPITVDPGVRYVVSYHAPAGHYSVTGGFFANGYTNGVLSAPGADTSDANGLFKYSPVPTFPTGTFNASNYWVDVVLTTAPQLTGITVTPNASSLAKGTSGQLTATASYSDSSTVDVTGTAGWVSSDPSVATVSATGAVTAVGEGTATVTATFETANAAATITVTPAELTSLQVTPATSAILTGGTVALTATGTFTDGTSSAVNGQSSWTSSAPAVATVSAAGVVTGVSAGTATITATSGAFSATATVAVSVPAPTVTGLNVTGAPAAALAKGLTAPLTATATLSNGTTQNVTGSATWTSSNPAVASVNASGVVTATGVGSATITAAYAGKTKSVTVTTKAAVMTGLVISPDAPRIKRLSSIQLKALATFTDGTTKDVTRDAYFTSSNLLIATVTNFVPPGSGGHVQSLVFAGTTKITATYNGFKDDVTVTVA